MPRESKEQKLNRIHSESLDDVDNIQRATQFERQQSLEDRRFATLSGAQFEDWLGDQFENKPKIEDNKIHLSVIRIINEYLNNRITVNFVPSDGSDSDTLADTCDKLYRADEQRSGASEAYDNSFFEKTLGGYGAYRFRSEYVDEDDPEDERQHICIDPIVDADTSVFFDLESKRQDKSDAKRCYVISSMTVQAYRDEYDDDPASWPKEIYNRFFDWNTPDVVYICEHYRVEKVKETIHVWQYLDGTEERISDDDLTDDRKKILTAIGAREIDTKTRQKKRVHKYLMSGSKILEDQGYIAGPNIPVVMEYGKRWFIDNVERAAGHVRYAKDMQRLLNMQLSKLAEIAALSPVEKPIVTQEQIQGHENQWITDNVKNYAFLLINPLTDANGQEQARGPLEYTRPPQVPPALAALLQMTEADIKELLGNTQQGEELAGNISTETAHLISNRLDMQAYIYMANAAKARKRGGEIWLGMAKEIYWEEGRKMKGIGQQGEIEQIELMRPIINKKTGEQEYENDLSKAKHDVIVDVGPESATRKASTLKSILNLINVTTDEQTKQILGTLAILNMEIEGFGDIKDYFRQRLVRMGVLEPTDEEAQQLAAEAQNQQPDPQTQYLQSAADAERARGQKAIADTAYTQAKAEETKTKTAEILSKMDREDAAQIMELLNQIIPPQQGPQQ